jgi:hypothetical protein
VAENPGQIKLITASFIIFGLPIGGFDKQMIAGSMSQFKRYGYFGGWKQRG